MTRDDSRSSDDSRDRDDEDRVVVVKKSSGIMPFLAGLAVGAGLALLFAPASGAETRRRLARGARNMRNLAGDAVDEASEKAVETLHEARERASERLGGVREAFAKKRGQVERAMSEGRSAAKQARADIEKRLAETKAAYQAGGRVARESKTRAD